MRLSLLVDRLQHAGIERNIRLGPFAALEDQRDNGKHRAVRKCRFHALVVAQAAALRSSRYGWMALGVLTKRQGDARVTKASFVYCSWAAVDQLGRKRHRMPVVARRRWQVVVVSNRGR